MVCAELAGVQDGWMPVCLRLLDFIVLERLQHSVPAKHIYYSLSLKHREEKTTTPSPRLNLVISRFLRI